MQKLLPSEQVEMLLKVRVKLSFGRRMSVMSTTEWSADFYSTLHQLGLLSYDGG